MSACTSLPEPPAATESQPIRLLCAPPGTGKTHAVIQNLAEDGTRAIYAAPTHDLCREIQWRMASAGIETHYWREGPNEEDACPHAPMVKFFREFGYMIRRGPCLHCEKKSACSYRKVFTGRQNRRAQVLILTSWHLRRPDFWTLKAAEDRPLIIIDEDATQAMAAPAEVKVEALSRFIASLQAIRDQCGNPFLREDRSDAAAWMLRRLHKPEEGGEAELALTDILRRACLGLTALCGRNPEGRWIDAPPVAGHLNEYDIGLLHRDDLFENLLAMGYEAANGKVEIPNLFARLRDLLLHPRPIHACPSAVRWPSVASIPPSRKVVLLDATAEPSVVEGVMSRPVEVLSIPPVRQEARIFQIMDRLLTRSGTRRDLKEDKSFIRTFVGEVARKHRHESLLAITYLEHEENLREFLEARHPRVEVTHYGALRGLDGYGHFDAGIVIGRPMPNEARLGLLAVSAFGRDALSEALQPPSLEWTLLQQPLGEELWQIRCQRYGDPCWDAVWRHVVSGELLQAIGRLRPLSNPASIYVLTSEPVPPLFCVEGVYAGEIFPSMVMANRRSDFQERVREYAEAYAAIVAEGGKPTNKAVCERMGIKPQKGKKYKALAMEILGQKALGG